MQCIPFYKTIWHLGVTCAYLFFFFFLNHLVPLQGQLIGSTKMLSLKVTQHFKCVIICFSISLFYTGMRLSMQTSLLFLTVWPSVSVCAVADSELICIKAKRSGVEEETWHFVESSVEKVGCEWWGIGLILTLWVSLYSPCTLCHHSPTTSFISVMHGMS